MYKIFFFLALSFNVVSGQDPEEPVRPMVTTPRGYWRPTTPKGYTPLTTPRGYTPLTRPQGYRPAEPPNGYQKAEPPNGYRNPKPPRGFGPLDAPQSTNGDDMLANQVKRQRPPGQRPPSTRRMTPRSAMIAYCSMSESDPAVGDQMKERLMAYISCKESTMVSINSGHIFPETGQANLLISRPGHIPGHFSNHSLHAQLPSLPTCYIRNAKSSWPSSDEQKWSYYCDKSNRRLVRKVERCVRKSVPNRTAYNKKARVS